MRNQAILLAVFVLAAHSTATRADQDVGTVRGKLDDAVAAVIEGGLAPPADDATYLRRVWIDLAGHTPSVPIARKFLDDKDPEKRGKMLARLLDSVDFADHWGRVLAGWAVSERPVARDAYDGRVLHAFFRKRLLAKNPYDQVVREMIAGSGVSDASGPANFFLRYQADPPRLAGAVGKNLLGITIQCAQCHDHPFASWKEGEFWGLAAAFARVRKMESGGDDNLKAVIEARRGELMRPGPDAPALAAKTEGKDAEKPPPKQVVVKPRLLNGKHIPDVGRRIALASWIVARDNPLFARNLVNRVWEQLYGRSLQTNLDNPAAKSNSLPVLTLLSEDFARNGHDLRRLLGIILLSKSYSQTSSTLARADWTRPAARPLSVDQLHASIAQATGYDGVPEEPAEGPVDDDETDPHADAVAARAEPHGEASSPADEGDENVDESKADRPAEALGEWALTLQRALVLLNGEFVREASRSAVRVSRALNGRRVDASQIEWACLATLSRQPTTKEQAVLGALLAWSSGLEDVYWVLINSSEFQTIR
jgi:hypothetical protein